MFAAASVDSLRALPYTPGVYNRSFIFSYTVTVTGREVACCFLTHLCCKFMQVQNSKCACRDAVVGRNCRFLQGPQTDKAEVKRMRDAMSADPPRPITVKLLNYRIDGQPFWNNLHVAPIRNSCGQVRAQLGVSCISMRLERLFLAVFASICMGLWWFPSVLHWWSCIHTLALSAPVDEHLPTGR